MRVQDGSEGWSVAHVRDVIKGCAEEVMAEMDWRDVGRVCLFGKRIGETKGLMVLVRLLQLRGNWERTDILAWPFRRDCRLSSRDLAMGGQLGSRLVLFGCIQVSFSG